MRIKRTWLRVPWFSNECYETAEQDVFQESNIINQKLDWSREILSDMHFSTGKNPVEYKGCCYESKEINAFSAKITSNSYVIALSTELLIGMAVELEEYFIHLDLRRYFWGKKRLQRNMFKKCMNISSYMLCCTNTIIYLMGIVILLMPKERLWRKEL